MLHSCHVGSIFDEDDRLMDVTDPVPVLAPPPLTPTPALEPENAADGLSDSRKDPELPPLPIIMRSITESRIIS